MFETAELGIKVDKKSYRERAPLLRKRLLDLQQELREFNGFPVIVVFAGVDGAGKYKTVNLLNEWMDPRWLATHAYVSPSKEERERPQFWRYWRDLPARGRIGLFLSSWYSQPVCDRAYGKSELAPFVDHLDRIVNFENALAEDGALILKFWMHLSQGAQKQRLESLQADPLTSWQVGKRDWKHLGMYDRFVEAAERTIMRTSTGKSVWTVVEGEDQNYRSLLVGETIRDALAEHLETTRLKREFRQLHKARVLEHPAIDNSSETDKADASGEEAGQSGEVGSELSPSVLNALDMSLSLKKSDYQKRLKTLQARLAALSREAQVKKISTIALFEGPDAAGKGGAIRRLTAPMQAYNYSVVPIAAPTDEEAAHHYLWRFWRRLGRAGRVTLFDRSWYGRVLVERVEGLASPGEWKRAYAEINDFEAQLIEHGIVLVKYWLHITRDEQFERFKARENTAYKRWKLTDEDWRNRDHWDDYERAVNDVVQHTSTMVAPWTLVEGNDKRYARVRVLETLCDRLSQALDSR